MEMKHARTFAFFFSFYVCTEAAQYKKTRTMESTLKIETTFCFMQMRSTWSVKYVGARACVCACVRVCMYNNCVCARACVSVRAFERACVHTPVFALQLVFFTTDYLDYVHLKT